MKRSLAALTSVLLATSSLAVAQTPGRPISGYPTSSSLTGAETIVGTQAGVTATIPVSQIKAYAVTSASIPAALGYTPAHSGSNVDITHLSGLTTALSVGQGGTGAATSSAAATSLGLGAASNATFGSIVTTGTTNVIAAGADPTGVADSAPAFRTAIQSNKTAIVPPGTYRLSSTVSAPCCANDAAAVLVQSKTNFQVIGYGATIVVDNGIALSTAFHFDQDSNYSVEGLTIQGTRSGLSGGQENVGITSTSDVNFTYRDIHFTGNFGGVGAALAADWLVNGSFSNILIDKAGQCADFAFLQNVSFQTIRATGADTNGNTGANQTGMKCLSVIVDGLNSATNNTGVSFTATNYVSITDVSASNFNVGAYLSTGTGYSFAADHWIANVGTSSTPGYGIQLDYIASGSFASTGAPVGNVVVNGDTFTGNGNATAGAAGLGITQANITNSDAIGNVSVTGSTFNNNVTQGISADGTTHLGCVSALNNQYLGVSQTINVNTNAATGLSACTPSEAAAFTNLGVANALTLTGTGTQLNWNIGGQHWAGVENNGSGYFWYLNDVTNSKTPLAVYANSTASLTINGSAITLVGNTVGFATTPVAIASLPASPVAGQRAAVNNAAACTLNAAFSGTGSTFCPAIYNGSAWVGG